MKIHSFISIAALALMMGACTETFLVGRYEHNYFWGNTSKGMREMLCPSGTLQKVLSDTQLSREMKDDLYQYNCSEKPSGAKIRQIYASMTDNEKNDLKNAFKKNYFAVNVIAVYDSECATSGRR